MNTGEPESATQRVKNGNMIGHGNTFDDSGTIIMYVRIEQTQHGWRDHLFATAQLLCTTCLYYKSKRSHADCTCSAGPRKRELSTTVCTNMTTIVIVGAP
jgi:hypothetical protein